MAAFAQRMTQYVSFYSGDPIRLTAAFYTGYDKDPLFDIVDRALGKTPDLDMPVSPDDFGEITPRRTPMAPGAIAAQYPAAFQPRPQRKD